MSPFIRHGAALATNAFHHAGAHAKQGRAGGARRFGAKRLSPLFLTLCAATVGLATAARAEFIQIPANSFVSRSGSEIIGDVVNGTLTNAKGVFFAPVPFPTDGAAVCQFILVHRDNDGDFDITARLMKQRIVIGGNPFTSPLIQMARIVTAGAVAGISKRRDLTIRQPTIDLTRAFYYVELTVPATTLEVLGVQIDVRSACL